MFKKYIFILVVFFTVAITSCSKKAERFTGFSVTDSGLYYKLQEIGDGKAKPVNGQYALLDLSFKTEKDSLFLDTKYQNSYGKVFYKITGNEKDDSFERGLMDMSEGDSMSFYVKSVSLFESYFKKPLPVFLQKESYTRVEVKLHKLFSEEEYRTSVKKLQELEDMRVVEEFNQIQKYVKENQLSAQIQEDGLFYITTGEGFGILPDTGMTVAVRMTGSFMNGKIFDNTFSKEPFEFKLGEEYQVVWGLQEGIKLMKEGEKAKLIIPSYLAFGEKGSSTGIVPPNTTVIYDIELLKVNE